MNLPLDKLTDVTDKATLRRQSAKAAMWSTVDRAASQGISLAVFLMLANLLEPRHFGLIAITATLTDFLDLFLDQGFAHAIVQKRRIEAEHLDTAFWVNVQIGGALTILCIALAPVLSAAFGEPALTAIASVLSLKFLLRSLNSTQGALLRRNLQFKALAVRSVIPLGVGGAVSVTMAHLGFGVWSLVAQHLVASAVAVLVQWNVNNWRPSWRFSRSHWRELFSFGINMTGLRFVSYFSRRADDLLIGYFLGAVILGYYAVAYRVLRTLISVLLGLIDSVALPTFSRVQHDPKQFREVWVSVMRIASLASCPVFVGVAVLAPELTATFFGTKWLPSAPVMSVLALAGLADSLGSLQSTALVATGRPQVRLRLAVARSVVTVIGFLIAIRWGILAVAVSLLVTTAVAVPLMNSIAMKRFTGVPYRSQLAPHLAPLLASLIMAASVMFARSALQAIDSRVALGLCVLVGILTYVISILLIQPRLLRQAVSLVQVAIPRYSYVRT